MKILIVAPTPFFADRGTHIRILEEALALEKLEYKIIIATYHIGKNLPQNIGGKITLKRISKLFFWYKKLEPGPSWQKIILDLMLIIKIFRLNLFEKPGVIYAHLHEGVILGWFVKKAFFWRKIKLIGDFHGSLLGEMVSHNYLKNPILRITFRFLEKFINNICDFAIASSREYFLKIKKTRRNNASAAVVLDGVNLVNYENKFTLRERGMEKYNLPKDKVKVVYAGSLISNKGIKYLLEAIIQFKDKSSKIHFIIAGYPIELVKEYIANHRLENFVSVISPLNYFSLPEILASSDIAVDPKDSQAGQASGKILQYMAAGLPVVCFDRINNRHYLSAGAYYSKNISSIGIVEGILYLAERKKESAKMGNMNRKRAEKFSWKKAGNKITEILKAINQK